LLVERTTGVRCETISGYLQAVGIVVPGRGRRRVSRAKPAISTASVSTNSGGANPTISEAVSPDASEAKAATRAEVSTDAVPLRRPVADFAQHARSAWQRAGTGHFRATNSRCHRRIVWA
jgi:hypothetical protein